MAVNAGRKSELGRGTAEGTKSVVMSAQVEQLGPQQGLRPCGREWGVWLGTDGAIKSEERKVKGHCGGHKARQEGVWERGREVGDVGQKQ